jgi:hypothetical protein
MQDVPEHITANNNEIRQTGYTNYKTNRSSTSTSVPYFSGFGGSVGSVIAPILDVLRPSKKDELVINYRTYGQGPSTSVSSSYVINPRIYYQQQLKKQQTL